MDGKNEQKRLNMGYFKCPKCEKKSEFESCFVESSEYSVIAECVYCGEDFAKKYKLTDKQWVKLKKGGWATFWLPVEIQNLEQKMREQKTRLQFKDYFLTEEEEISLGKSYVDFQFELDAMDGELCKERIERHKIKEKYGIASVLAVSCLLILTVILLANR